MAAIRAGKASGGFFFAVDTVAQVPVTLLGCGADGTNARYLCKGGL